MIRILYLAITAWLSVYGLQSLIFTTLYLRYRDRKPSRPDVSDISWPSVAVQLPIYNERHVVERLIDAAAALDYPRERLEIQVLDDSTDDTTELAEQRAAFHRAHGVSVKVVHRLDRTGYKAGALAQGLRETDAEFLAIFDADFRPRPDFLLQTVPFFFNRPDVGAIQTRWAHLNEVYSPLTRAQSIMLDGHFVIEQSARNRSGLLMCFNGSGGVWRRTAIDSAGGWQYDTMTEDMDLSYRSQIAGWRMLYLPNVEAPAELPPQMEAFKQQQARWARGSMQCLRKLALPILDSELSFLQKIMALVHMSTYLSHPLVIVLLLASLPMLLESRPLPAFMVGLGFASLGPPLLFAIAQGALHKDWGRRMLYLPVLFLVGLGIGWSTTRACWQGLTRWGGTFGRTPKFRLEGRQGAWTESIYKLLPDRALLGEIGLALYALVTTVVAWARGNYGAVPYLLLYVLGFGSVAAAGLYQTLRSPVTVRRRAS